MSVDCRAAAGMLVAHLSGELSPGEAAALEAHLAGCPGCREKTAFLRSVMDAVAQPDPRPDGFTQAVLRRAARESRGGLRTAWLSRLAAPRPLWRFAAAASLAVVLLGVGLLAVRRGANRPAPERPPELHAPAGPMGGAAPRLALLDEGCVAVVCGAL